MANWFTRKRTLIFFGIGIIVVAGIAGYFAYQQGYSNGYRQGYSNGYQRGTWAGYPEGYQKGYQPGYQAGYEAGYNKGFEKGVRTFYPKGEVVKILSYNLVRDWEGRVKVVGELKNLSNIRVSATLDCALIDSAGKIVSITGGQMWFLDPQGTTFFMEYFPGYWKEHQAVDARLTVK